MGPGQAGPTYPAPGIGRDRAWPYVQLRTIEMALSANYLYANYLYTQVMAFRTVLATQEPCSGVYDVEIWFLQF